MELLESGALDFVLVRNFAIAVFIGALIGVEREHQAESDKDQFGGLRTFILIAALGAASAWLGQELVGPGLFIAGGSALGFLIGVSYYIAALKKKKKLPGMTTEVAALLTYVLGGAAVVGYPEMAVVLGVVTSAVLTFKQAMHAGVRALGRDDITAGLKLLFATFIVLPLLPNEALDPFGAINPFKLWWLVILISSLSLIGYVAVRLLGANRGMALTGLFGGLVSSTAVTLTFAKRSKETAGINDALAIGILLAWAVMFVRVIIEVAVVNMDLVAVITPPMAAMFVASAGLLAALHFSGRRAKPPPPTDDTAQEQAEQEDVDLKNPFNLTSAIKFGLFFAFILLLVKVAQRYVPDEALYLVAALAGATDVDAITLSLAEAAGTGLSETVAVLSILLAALSNTIVKCGLVISLGHRGLAKRISLATVVIFAAGGIAFGVQQLVTRTPTPPEASEATAPAAAPAPAPPAEPH